MPIYEFRCQNCGKIFEELVINKTGSEYISCIHCQSKNISKIFSKFAIRQGEKESGEKSSNLNRCSGCTTSSCSTCGI